MASSISREPHWRHVGQHVGDTGHAVGHHVRLGGAFRTSVRKSKIVRMSRHCRGRQHRPGTGGSARRRAVEHAGAHPAAAGDRVAADIAQIEQRLVELDVGPVRVGWVDWPGVGGWRVRDHGRRYPAGLVVREMGLRSGPGLLRTQVRGEVAGSGPGRWRPGQADGPRRPTWHGHPGCRPGPIDQWRGPSARSCSTTIEVVHELVEQRRRGALRRPDAVGGGVRRAPDAAPGAQRRWPAPRSLALLRQTGS